MKKLFLLSIFFVLGTGLLFAQATPVENLYEYHLQNGLTLFVAENHNAPLVYIEIAIRGGTIAEEPETAGLFHMYEHMMFKSNSLYKSAQDIQNAMDRLGVSTFNGTTSSECVNYFFTVPAAKIRDGLEFWNAAIRTPTIDPDEFETEKAVVVSELEGSLSNPVYWMNCQVSQDFFPEKPWCILGGGSVTSVLNSSVDQLRAIQAKYYVPDNAALFVGGDVEPDQVCALVEEVFGDWQSKADPWINDTPFAEKPFEGTKYYVVPYESFTDQLAEVLVYYRGADSSFDRQGALAGDMIQSLCANPGSAYMQTLVSEFPIPDPTYAALAASSARKTGLFNPLAIFFAPGADFPEMAKAYADRSQELVHQTARNCTEEELQAAMQLYWINSCYQEETAQSLLAALRANWITADSDYYYNYLANLSQISSEEMVEYCNRYVTDECREVIVVVNPAVYQAYKAEYDAAGFVEITSESGDIAR